MPRRFICLGLRLTAAVLLTVAVGACGDRDQGGSVESAVESLFLSLEATDPSAAAAVFTEDGVYVDKLGGEWVGRSRIADYVERVGPGITRCVRAGAVKARDDGRFAFPVEFTYSGVDYQGEAAVTMADGLILRYEYVTEPFVASS